MMPTVILDNTLIHSPQVCRGTAHKHLPIGGSLKAPTDFGFKIKQNVQFHSMKSNFLIEFYQQFQ